MDAGLVASAAAGGAAYWVWSAISWMALPWHHASYRKFADEDEVVRVLERNAPVTAVYGYPAPPAEEPGRTKEERAAADAAATERLARGPLVLAVIQRRGFPPLWRPLLGSVLIYVVVAGLWAFLAERTGVAGYGERVLFFAVAGLAGALASRLPDWNWHGYPPRYTTVLVADATIGWSFAGLAMAALL